MLSQWEKGFKELAGKNVAPPEFMATLMGRYLTAMNMPSRADLAAVNERLHRIENQLARLLAEQSGLWSWRAAWRQDGCSSGARTARSPAERSGIGGH